MRNTKDKASVLLELIFYWKELGSIQLSKKVNKITADNAKIYEEIKHKDAIESDW